MDQNYVRHLAKEKRTTDVGQRITDRQLWRSVMNTIRLYISLLIYALLEKSSPNYWVYKMKTSKTTGESDFCSNFYINQITCQSNMQMRGLHLKNNTNWCYFWQQVNQHQLGGPLTFVSTFSKGILNYAYLHMNLIIAYYFSRVLNMDSPSKY